MIIPREKPLFTKQQAAELGASVDIAPRRWEERLVYKMVDPWGTSRKTHKIGLIILAIFLVFITACLAMPLVVRVGVAEGCYEDRVNVVVKAYNLVVLKERSLEDVRGLRGLPTWKMEHRLYQLDPNGQLFQKTLQLKKKIEELEDKISMIDEFMDSHFELMSKVQQAMKRNGSMHAKSERPSTDFLDPNDLSDKMTLLELKKIELEAALDERKLFIERNPEVFECFKKYVMERPNTGAFSLSLG